MNKYISVAISNEEQLESAHALKEGSTVIILSVEGAIFIVIMKLYKFFLKRKLNLLF